MDAILDLLLPIPAQVLVGAIVVLVVIHVILGSVTLLIYMERKVSAYAQDRLGPNRCGLDFGLPFLKTLFRRFHFWGLGQSLADGIKLILKEDYRPRGADKYLFTLAPMLAVIPALIAWAVIPWGGYVNVGDITIGSTLVVEGGRALVAAADLNIGFIYLLAVASLGVYGVTLGGWASNNKFSFLGGLRCSASMISYEVPMGLCLLAIVLVSGSVSPQALVEQQVANGWYVIAMPLACLLFFVCSLAESNRAPFDNAECEQELVGGFHTEYSSMRFALFMLGEYAHIVGGAAFLVMLFFGGYHLPFIEATRPEAMGVVPALLKFGVFTFKIFLVILMVMMIRWTIPRLRYDQVMKLCWNALIPLSIALVVATSLMLFIGQDSTVAMLIMNVGLTVLAVFIFPVLPQPAVNRRIPLAGSRFSPLPGEQVRTGATGMAATESGVAMGAPGTVSMH